jgi:hypothetical protein
MNYTIVDLVDLYNFDTKVVIVYSNLENDNFISVPTVSQKAS